MLVETRILSRATQERDQTPVKQTLGSNRPAELHRGRRRVANLVGLTLLAPAILTGAGGCSAPEAGTPEPHLQGGVDALNTAIVGTGPTVAPAVATAVYQAGQVIKGEVEKGKQEIRDLTEGLPATGRQVKKDAGWFNKWVLHPGRTLQYVLDKAQEYIFCPASGGNWDNGRAKCVGGR